MKVNTPFRFFFALVFALALAPAACLAMPDADAGFSLLPDESGLIRANLTCRESAAGQVSLSFNLAESQPELLKEGAQWRLSCEGVIGAEGMPDLPAVSRWVRLPDRGNLIISTSISQICRTAAPEPRRYHDYDEAQQAQYAPDAEPEIHGVFPAQAVEMSEPMILRGVRVALVTMYPIQWDADQGEYIQNLGIEAEIRVVEGRGINEVEPQVRSYSRDFDRMLDALLLNPPQRDHPGEAKPGGYLVVMDNNAPQEALEFVHWKRAEGRQVEILRIQEDQTVPTIKGLISERYRNTGFEYLVFMGSDDADPPLFIPFEENYYDIFYAQLEGNDNLPDVAVGTFNCVDINNLVCAVRRAVSYQSQPFNENEEWISRAMVGVGACSVPRDLAPSYTGKWVAETLRRSGFENVATSFFSDNDVDDPSRLVEDQYNAGANLIIIRAHEWNLAVGNIRPTGVFPFHFLVSSGTISPGNNGAFNWAFRQGTPGVMKGPSAGFGHYSSPRTNDANALVGSMTEALFLKDIKTFGWARNYALLNLRRLMADGLDRYQYESSHWRYYGDPSQWIWRDAPRPVQLQCDEIMPIDATTFPVDVVDENNQPVPNALVTLVQGDEFSASAFTNENGQAVIGWDYIPDGISSELPLHLSVTGEGLRPAFLDIQPTEPAIWVTVSEYEYLDDNDGLPNPGEAGNVFLTLHNPSGGATPQLASVALFTEFPWVGIPWVEQQVDPINPGESIRLDEPFRMEVERGCPDGEPLRLQVRMRGVNEQVWIASLEFEASGPDFVFDQANDVLEPNQVTPLTLRLLNVGRQANQAMDAELQSLSLFVEVEQPVGRFAEAEPQGDVFQIINNDDLAFSVNVHANVLRGMTAKFRLILSNEQVQDTVDFEMPLGFASIGDALGPDTYGYFALDDNDEGNAFADAFDFNWIEINPNLEERDFLGVGFELPGEEEPDVSFLVDMPFPFRYYGREYEQITVCTNGWIGVGDQTNLMNQQNWDMPGINGAYGMIAPFWDRLRYERAGDGVFTFYDEANGRLIIEWSAGVNGEGQLMPNVFECIIYNPFIETTITWDSPLLFQYNIVNNVQNDNNEANAFCTVGISSPDGKDGLTYAYWNNYPQAAEVLQNGRAILWNTLSYIPPASAFGRVTRWIDGASPSSALVESSQDISTRYLFDGRYRLVGVSGEFNVTVSAPGYETQTVEGLAVQESGEVEHNFILAHGWLRSNVDTLRLEYTVEPGKSIEWADTLRLTNAGNAICNIDSILLGPLPDFITCQISPASPLSLNPQTRADLVISYQAFGLETGVWETYLLLTNDSPMDTLFIPVVIDALVGVPEADKILPDQFSLGEIYPNPFNPTAATTFDLPRRSEVKFALYDVSGKLSREYPTAVYAAGQHTLTIEAGDLPSGVYLLRMTAPEFTATRRVTLVR